jgi:hypothetical protein
VLKGIGLCYPEEAYFLLSFSYFYSYQDKQWQWSPRMPGGWVVDSAARRGGAGPRPTAAPLESQYLVNHVFMA